MSAINSNAFNLNSDKAFYNNKQIDLRQVAKAINTLAEAGNSEAVKIRNAAFGNSWASIWRTENVARIRCAIRSNEMIRSDIAKMFNANPKLLTAFKVGIFSKHKMRLCKSELLKENMELRKQKISTQMDKSFAQLAKVHSSAGNIQNIFNNFAKEVQKYVPNEKRNDIRWNMGSISKDLGSSKSISQEVYRALDGFKNDPLDYDGTTKFDRLVKGRNANEYNSRMDDYKSAVDFSNDFERIASLANDIINSANGDTQKQAVKGLVVKFLDGLIAELGKELPKNAIDDMQKGNLITNTVENAAEHAEKFSEAAVNVLKKQFKEQCGIDYDAILTTRKIKTQAKEAYDNMNDKVGDHKNRALVLSAERLPKFQNYLDTGRPGSAVIKVLDSLLQDEKITQEVYNQCKGQIALGQQQLSQLSPPNFQERFPDIFKENQKVSDELRKLIEVSESGEGDYETPQKNIDESLGRLDSLCQEKNFRKQVQAAAQPYQTCLNGVFDDVISLVGEENKSALEEIKTEFNKLINEA